jgi:rhodanese-related sulfurtransferase
MKKLILLLAIAMLSTVFAGGALAFQDISPAAAYALSGSDANSYIVDVRTIAEWQWLGHPGINKTGEGSALDGKVVNISYKIEKKGATVINPSFLNEINELFSNSTDVTLIIMCRSGSRSKAAATLLEEAGYTVLNMVTGFEGGKDANGYRTVNGWANDGLPYNYSGAGYAD